MSDWRDLRPVAPTRLPSSRPGGLYGLALMLLVLGVVGSVLLYAYVHLAANARGWPPEGTEPLARWPVVAVAVLALFPAVAAMAAYRHAHADARDRRHVLAALLASIVAGAAAFGVLAAWMGGLPHGSEHAYGSSVLVLAAFVAGLLGAGLLATALVSCWVVLGHAGTAPADSVRLLRAYQWFTAATAAVALATLALGGGS